MRADHSPIGNLANIGGMIKVSHVRVKRESMGYTHPAPLRRRKVGQYKVKEQRKALTAHVQPASGHSGSAAGTEYVATSFQGVLCE